ncbi:MAG: aminoglycoside phosphotransferase family protein [Clostridiales bacterium]|nr:aminoglycoside phosphotransferase family protein [Clostridiales bacterium]
MHNLAERDDTYIARLAEFIRGEYGIAALFVAPATRGHYGETWRMDTESGSYFLKLDYFPRHREKYRNSLEVVQYLCDCGIDYVGRILPTARGALSADFNGAVLAVFDWIDGVNDESDAIKRAEYNMLVPIYNQTKPGFAIPSLVFSDEAALRFMEKWDALKADPKTEDEIAIRALLARHSAALHHYAARLRHFAALCAQDYSRFYLTHGDAGGNFLWGDDRNYIIDWDETMYAPPERDAWVMCCRDWAMRLFADALAQSNIGYTLRPERLAFYCYHMFFMYIGEFLDDLTLYGKRQDIEEYFDCWVMERMEYVDML